MDKEREPLGLATEILRDLKQSNERTVEHLGRVIKGLTITIVVALAVIGIQFGINTYERMQYDYVSSYEANGLYSLIDSDGNMIAHDFTQEQLDIFREWWEVNGDGEGDKGAG